MKIKQYLYISDPVAFAKGNYNGCFSVFGYEVNVKAWIKAGEVELDIVMTTQDAVIAAGQALDRKIDEIQAEAQLKINDIKQVKAELLALSHDKNK